MSEVSDLEEINIYPDRPTKMDGRARTAGKNMAKLDRAGRNKPSWKRQLERKNSGKKA